MRKELGMAIALAVMCVLIALSNQNFYGSMNIFNTTRQIAMLGIYAIGVSFVIATGGIDLSIGSVITLSAVVLAKVSAPGMGWEQPIWVGVLAAMGVSLLIGLFQGALVTWLGVQPFIVTLTGMLLFRGLAHVLAGGGTLSFGDSPFKNLAKGSLPLGFTSIPYLVLIFLIVAAIASYVLHFTVFGRHVYAIGGNRDAARYSGVPVKKIELETYVISAGLAGLSGIVMAAYSPTIDQGLGTGAELNAIAAAVLGGISLRGGEGTVPGIIIGSAVIQVIANGFNMFKIRYTAPDGSPKEWHMEDYWREVVTGAVILGAVILDQVTHILQERKKTKGK